jgi:hypothetical protein
MKAGKREEGVFYVFRSENGVSRKYNTELNI